MWTYEQSTGRLKHNNKLIAIGYAGYEQGKNKPDMQSVKNIGPLPCGIYEIMPPCFTVKHGPYVLELVPNPHNEMFGRSEFLMHGDSKSTPGKASHGCIIMDRMTREAVWNSKDHLLEVVSGL